MMKTTLFSGIIDWFVLIFAHACDFGLTADHPTVKSGGVVDAANKKSTLTGAVLDLI